MTFFKTGRNLLNVVAATVIAAGVVFGQETGTFNLSTWTGTGTGWNTAAGDVLTIEDGGNVRVTGTAGNNQRIAVDVNAVASITLENVVITRPGANNSALELPDDANVKVILEGPNNVLTGGTNRAGLHVQTTATLTIEGTGSLTARGTFGSYGSAGIGGGHGDYQIYRNSGTIIINSGTITAIGAGDPDYAFYAGAGIGGGDEGSSGNITINGGVVTATGNGNAQGIGRGGDASNSHGTLTMNGNAIVFAGSVGDMELSRKVSGILIIGTEQNWYGDEIILTNNATIPAGYLLIVDSDKTLTIPSGMTLTNNGEAIKVGTINHGEPNYGTWGGE